MSEENNKNIDNQSLKKGRLLGSKNSKTKLIRVNFLLEEDVHKKLIKYITSTPNITLTNFFKEAINDLINKYGL